MNVGEASGVNINDALLFVDEDRNELQTFYHFDHTGFGISKENFMYADDNNKDLIKWKKIFQNWDQVFAEKGWGTIYLGNHDMSRMTSRFGNDSVEFRELSAKMLHTYLLSMRGTPYIYNGDEIGMINTNHTNIKKYQDLYTINYYNQLKQKGEDHQAFLNSHSKISRDNGRTPLQWNDNYQAGFTTGNPWLALNENYQKANVAEQENRADSVLHYFRTMIQLRKKYITLIYGTFEPVDEHNKQLFAYIRHYGNHKLLIVLNFSEEQALLDTEIDLNSSLILISNYKDPSRNKWYKPFEAVIYEIER
jgi:oligo-1,6-glucosidase